MNAIYSPEFSKIWAQIVAKCWKDETFKQRVIENPAEVLNEFGYQVHPQLKLKTSEENYSEQTITLFLPAKPTSVELEEKELKMISAADASCSAGSCACYGGCQ